MKGKVWVADFETTGEKQTMLDGKARVWAVSMIDVKTEEVVLLSTDVNDFLEYIEKDDQNHSTKKVYFHNLKFDGQFIVNLLYERGFKHSTQRRLYDNEFSTIVSDMGQFYEIKISFKNYGSRNNQVIIHDSYKKLPFSVDRISRAFKLDTIKGSIDYNAYREFPYTMTKEEEEYVINDVKIVAQALKIQYSQGLNKMTIGSDALGSYINIINKDKFDYLFPELNLKIDGDVRQSYKGGWVYMKPELSGEVINNVLAIDVNSLYPYVMRYKELPYGRPIYYTGKYKEDKDYPLYTQLVRVSMTIKKDHLPMIQLKNNWRFKSTEYITTTGHEPVDIFLTSVDLKLMLEHYDIHHIEYLEGFKYRSHEGLFDEYIDHWNAIKERSVGAIRELAKLMLNNLYGKFGTNPIRRNKYPEYVEGEVKWVLGEESEGKSAYIPMASFITAYAREKTIRTAQMLYPHFIYSDTDSIKLRGITLDEVKGLIDIHPTKLGAWADEGTSHKFKVLRAKTYITEEIDGDLNIVCAGLPNEARKNITFDSFRFGMEVGGKLMQRRVKGGVILKETTFKIEKGK